MTQSSSSKPKAIVLGAGICGKTAAYLLKDTHDVTIFDLGMDNGLLKSKCYQDSNGSYVYVDYCAPHVFNSRDPEVLEFVFRLLPKWLWEKRKRNAKIFIDNKIIGYPFEYNLWQFGEEFMSKCLQELGDEKIAPNLHDFYLHRFGKTMCEKYHFPYNEKIWEYALCNIGTSWIKPNKVPINSIEELKIINADNMGNLNERNMTHSEFYYPVCDGIEMLISSIPIPQPIKIQDKFSIMSEDGKLWVWNGLKLYTANVIVSTIPIDYLCYYTNNECIYPAYHGTDIIVAKSDIFKKNPDITWMYFPQKEHFWHRMANVGLLQGMDTDLITIEAPSHAYKGQYIDLSPYHFEVIDYWNIPRTYPIETKIQPKIDAMIEKLKNDRIYSIGRWGSHNYNSNMDLSIRMAMDCVKEIRGAK